MKYPTTVVAALLIVCCEAADAQGFPPQRFPQRRETSVNESVTVLDRQISFEFAWRDAFERAPDAAEVGYYAWRISVDAPEPFTMVLMADTAMRSSQLQRIVRASTLRMCPSATPASILECTTPIKARTETDALSFRLIIDDKEFVDRIRHERPLYYTSGHIEPRGRVKTVQPAWQYRDKPPKPR